MDSEESKDGTREYADAMLAQSLSMEAPGTPNDGSGDVEEDPDDPPYEDEDEEIAALHLSTDDSGAVTPSKTARSGSGKKRKAGGSGARRSTGKAKKRRKKIEKHERYDESLDDALLEATLNEGIYFDEPNTSAARAKKKKTPHEITQEWGLGYNIEMEYTESDYEDCVDYKSYVTKIKPVISEDYPDLTSSQITVLLKAFWNEFKENNPKKSQKTSTSASPINEKKVKPLRIKIQAGTPKSVHMSSEGEDDQGPSSYVVANDSDGAADEDSNSKPLKKAKMKSGLGVGKQRKKKKSTPVASVNSAGAKYLRKQMRKEAGNDEDVPDEDHQDYCEECQAAGDILLCDTCPKAYHLVCLDPPLEVAPEGMWICPTCEKDGAVVPGTAAEQAESEEDEHNEYCKICRDGGELLCCDKCPCAYHMRCLNPPLLDVPNGSWVCPRCSVIPLDRKAARILFWRWKYPADGEGVAKPGKRGHMKPWREFLCKWEHYSYWKCDWVDEQQLELAQPGMLRSYMKKMGDMEEPPMMEDGSSFGRKRHEHMSATDKKLEEQFYRFGIKPEWLQIHRVINHWDRKGLMYYLVKWRDLSHTECSWELEGDCGAPDFEQHVQQYWKNRENMQEIHELKRGGSSKKKKKSRRDGFAEEPKEKIDLRQKYEKQPDYLTACGGQLHDYQLEGINWLRFSYSQGTDTILADEMGLGKTIQSVTFLYSLFKEGHSTGPFLVSAPLSTIINWEREFEFWAPDFYVVTYVGSKEARAIIRENELTLEDERRSSTQMKIKEGSALKFHVLLTSYELISVDASALQSIDWSVLVVDEAHRLKNNQSKFFRVLDQYRIGYRLLLTGTPLQNNLEELYHLLNFMSKDKFGSMQEFLDTFADIGKEEQVKKLHDLLASHMLRRLKADVLKNLPSKSEFIVRVDLSPMQKKYYKAILTRNFEALNAGKGSGQNVSLLNIMMELKKCANHPYLFQAAMDEAPKLPNGYFEGSALVKNCGKLVLLEKMLKVLKETNNRVLIFSQMTKVLDILEDFLEYLGHKYERVDGAITGQLRQEAIDRFNAPNAEQFVFLLSTRAGGLGINLATADTVIIYDSDWNPHNDIQAFSRAHRIGQANKVMIYRFVTRNTVEERITQVAKKKMMLTHLVVRPGMHQKGGSANMSKQELDDILKFGTEDLFKDDTEEGKDDTIVYDESAVRQLLDRSNEGVDEKNKLLDDYLSSFKVASYIVQDKKEEEDDDDEETEVIKQDEVAPVQDPDYWEKLLRHHYEQEQENTARLLGKGKRVRKHVNYYTDGIVVTREEESDWPVAAADAEDYDSEYSGDHGDPEDTEDFSDNSGRRRKNRDVLPPLLAKVNGQIEVFGFNSRQRKSFYNAVLRWGMPPNDAANSQWLVRDLRGKSEKEFKAYSSMFLRHLCEPTAENAEKYADEVPKEGVQRQPVLTRIGIMSLIRKKVVEFEKVNGKLSMPDLIPPDLRLKLEDIGCSSSAKTSKAGSKQSSRASTPLPDKAKEALAAEKEPEKPETEAKRPDSVPASEENVSTETAKTSETEAAEVKAEAKNEPMETDAVDAKTDAAETKTETSDEQKSVTEADSSKANEVKSETTASAESTASEAKPAEAAKTAEQKPATSSASNAAVQAAANVKRRFMFNIADGGFTELHTLWVNEERAIKANIRKENEIWHRKHDYWLLCGIVQHGYGRYQDIQSDMRYMIINEPFKNEVGKPNYIENKNRFISKRFKLLEQALVIEEQLRRAAYLDVKADNSPIAASLQTLNSRFSELESLADSHQHLSKESLSGNKSANAVLHKVLLQLDELLSEMKQDAAKLPTSLTRVASVTQRLQLTERSILSRLYSHKQATAEAAAAREAAGADSASTSSEAATSLTPTKLRSEEYISSSGYNGPFIASIGAVPYRSASTSSTSSQQARPEGAGSVEKPVVIED